MIIMPQAEGGGGGGGGGLECGPYGGVEGYGGLSGCLEPNGEPNFGNSDQKQG